MKKNGLLLSLLFIFSFIIRVWGINYGSPLNLHIDENWFLSVGVAMVRNNNLNPVLTEGGFLRPSFTFYFYWLLTLIQLSWAKLFYLPLTKTNLDLFSIVFLARFVNAVLSTTAVYLCFIIAKTIFNFRVAVFSALILSTSFVYLLVSHYGTSDVPQGLFQLIAFYFIFKVLQTGRTRNYIYSGLFIGFALSANYHAVISGINLIVAHFLHITNLPKRRLTKNFSSLFFGLFFVLVGFVTMSPYSLVEFGHLMADTGVMGNIHQNALAVVSGSSQKGFPTPFWWIVYLFTTGLGPQYFTLFFIGVLICLRRVSRMNLLLISFPVAWFIIMSTNSVRFDRHIVPILPMIAIISSLGLVEIVDYLRHRILPIVLLMIFVFMSPFSKAIIFDFIVSQKDTRIVAADWASENIDKDTLIFTFGHSISVGQLLQGRGFDNVEMVGLEEINRIYSYPGEILILDEDNRRISKMYQEFSPHRLWIQNYNLVDQTAIPIKRIGQRLFESEFFSPFFLGHSSTVNSYHNPTLVFYKVPKLEKYAKHNSRVEIPSSRLIRGINIISFTWPLQKGDYSLSYDLNVSSCGFGLAKIAIIVKSTRDQEFSRKIYDCRDIVELDKLIIPVKLDKTRRLIGELKFDAGVELSVSGVQIYSSL